MSKRDFADKAAEQAQDAAEDLGRIGSKAGQNAARGAGKAIEGAKKGKLAPIILVSAVVVIVAILAWQFLTNL